MAALKQQLVEFFATETAGGFLILAATALALLAANSGVADTYHHFTHLPIALDFGAWNFTEPLAEWVKDVLMVGFFLMVGLELKRELLEGLLADRRQVMLPLVAAIGGMAVPAALFVLINHQHEAYLAGWAIPTATDIAFALAVLLLAARHSPPALKIFLLAIAIFDDLGAILIIAFFYSSGIAVIPLLLTAAAVLLLALLNHKHVNMLWPYMVVGAGLCIALYQAGIHTTIGGVVTAFAIPLRGSEEKSPLNRLMHVLHPWVNFAVLPLFAFTAAGVSFAELTWQELSESLPLGIAAGLFFGKQIGIFGSSWLLIRSKFAHLPEGMGWAHVYAVSLIAGIGFTMSLFIGSLAFADPHMLGAAKMGVLAGSLLSALSGWVVLKMLTKR